MRWTVNAFANSQTKGIPSARPARKGFIARQSRAVLGPISRYSCEIRPPIIRGHAVLNQTQNRSAWMVIVLLLTLVVNGVSSAHAFLDHAEPRVGSKISASPDEVKIWFTQELEPAFSSIRVFDATGNEVDKKDTRQDEKDKKLLKVSVSSLPPGEFKVVWKVVSVDTHRTNGDFKFTIKP